MLHAVIMAGGSGTRFWPMSRQRFPKQFLKLHGDRSLLQQAYDRIASLVGADGVLVMTNAQHVEETRRQLPDLPESNVIGEPTGRDTAPCIALAAAVLQQADPEATMMVLSADHLIEPTEAFHRAIRSAAVFLDQEPDTLLTIGIPPTYPATGYGYLRRAKPWMELEGVAIHALAGFHEKPDLAKAEDFVRSGEYCWNAGIFAWKTATILRQFTQHAPKVLEPIETIAANWRSERREAVLAEQYPLAQKISIDFAIMEKAERVAMIEAPFSWDDVGSWLALERVQPASAEGNVVLNVRQVGLRTKDCVVAGPSNHTIATLGVSNLIIVHTPDATLVADRSEEQSVKLLLEELKARGLEGLL